MPFHLAGFLEDIDSAGVFANLTALADNVLFVQGDDLRVPELNSIVLLSGGADGVAAPRFRLDSPTLAENMRFEVTAINSQDAAAVEPDSPPKLLDLRRTPLVLGIDELLRCELNNNPAAPQDQWLLCWFADGPTTPVEPAGVFTVRGTGTGTLAVNVWTADTITLDENLRPGTYAIVGMRAISAGLVAARIVSRDQVWRPGCLGADVITDVESPIFRYGQMGIWTTFPFTQLPTIEFLSMSADTAQTVHLDLLRVG